MKNLIDYLAEKIAGDESFKIDLENKEKIKKFLDYHRHWNNGLGLIVRPDMGEKLIRLGFKEGEGFSINKKLPTK